MNEITILHLSDLQFGKNHRFAGSDLSSLDNPYDTLLARLWEDLQRLKNEQQLQPDMLIVTGDLTEMGMPGEFKAAREFLERLTDGNLLDLPRCRVAIIPGNHDVNRKACSSYFENCEAYENQPKAPWWPKWDCFKTMFDEFYQGTPGISFNEEQPWTLFEIPEVKVVIAGLNSTMVEGHDCKTTGKKPNPGLPRHIGFVGESQLHWFSDQLKKHRNEGWFRIGIVHHNQQRGCKYDDENLKDAEELERILRHDLNLLLHGHTHQANLGWLNRNTPILATGSAALALAARPIEIPNQYQIIQIRPGNLRRYGRTYFPTNKSFGTDVTVDENDGRTGIKIEFDHVSGIFPDTDNTLDPVPGPIPQTLTYSTDLKTYLIYIRKQTQYIDIRGLLVGSHRVLRFSIEHLYIPLELTRTTADRAGRTYSGADMPTQKVAPHEVLKNRLVVVVGDPGSGKTTFLHRIAYKLASALLTNDVMAAKEELGYDDVPIPLFVPIHKLAEYRKKLSRLGAGPSLSDLPTWITRYLHEVSLNTSLGLCEDDFLKMLQSGNAVLLLDGLDEASTETERVSLVELIQNISDAYEKCRILVTTRPATYQGSGTLPGFTEAWLAPLEPSVVEVFFHDWSWCLHPEDPVSAEDTRSELLKALQSRAEIRRLARSPVMLTALAVVQWNEKRLPEYRAELYESIIGWLSKSRSDRPGYVRPERRVGYLQNLALAMQMDPAGRKVQVSRMWASEKIAGGFREIHDPEERIAQAESFLGEEENDSGIIIARNGDIRFWHLTFQEYLSARALMARSDEERNRLLYARQELYRPEWREMVLLHAGILLKMGPERVDQMLSCILSAVDGAPFKDRARCSGLLGAIVRDLSPLQYRFVDHRYEALLNETYAIFDAIKSCSVPITDAIEAAEALGQAGDRRFMGASSNNWVKMTAGRFRLGAQKQYRRKFGFDSDASDLEGPVHEANLHEYYIGRYPVTVLEYARFVEDGGYEDESFWQDESFRRWPLPYEWEMQMEHPTRPITGVSWYEATAYAAWLGCRLPTEDEWERAARGKEGRKYPWGNEEPLPFFLNYSESRIGHPTPVGIYPRGSTPEGVFDMAGNVWEWCNDDDPHTKSDYSTIEGPMKMLRGGCWAADNNAWHCRSSNRGVNKAGTRVAQFGFRLVRDS